MSEEALLSTRVRKKHVGFARMVRIAFGLGYLSARGAMVPLFKSVSPATWRTPSHERQWSLLWMTKPIVSFLF